MTAIPISQRRFRWLKTLEELNRSGAKQFLFSHRGHESSQHYLGAYGLLDYFTECVDSSYGFTPKPAPDGVLYLLGKYGLDKDETLMVGDRELDVMAGKNAGTYGCLFTKEKNVETNADFVVSSSVPFTDFADDLSKMGKEMNLSIHAMHEDIFNAMHTV